MTELRAGAINSEIRLYCTLRLARGSHTDIVVQAGISKSSFYRIVWETIKAIARSKHEALQNKFPQSEKECKEVAEGSIIH